MAVKGHRAGPRRRPPVAKKKKATRDRASSPRIKGRSPRGPDAGARPAGRPARRREETIRTDIELWLMELQRVGRAPSTLAAYRSALRGAVPSLLTAKTPGDIVRSLSAGAAESTRQSYLAALRGFLSWHSAPWARRLRELPRVKVARGDPRPFKTPELRKLEVEARRPPRYTWGPDHFNVRLLFWILRVTGCRTSDALRLTLRDVDLTPGAEVIAFPVGKADKPHHAPIVHGWRAANTLLRLLRDATRRDARPWERRKHGHEPGRALLISRQLTPWSGRQARRAFGQLAKRAGVELVRRGGLHQLRHTRSTELARRGLNAFEVAAVIGTTVETAAVYTDVSAPRDLIERAQAGAVDGSPGTPRQTRRVSAAARSKRKGTQKRRRKPAEARR